MSFGVIGNGCYTIEITLNPEYTGPIVVKQQGVYPFFII